MGGSSHHAKHGSTSHLALNTSIQNPALAVEPDIDVPFARIDCSGNELKYVAEVLDSGWLTSASKSQELEQRFAMHIGVQYSLAVNSCTSGLHLALEAMGVQRGDKVLLPTMTFTATAEVIRYLDAIPVLMDVDPDTSLISTDIVERSLNAHPDAKVLIAVHYGGQAAPMMDASGEGIVSLCHKRGVAVLEDAAHAFPTKQRDRYVGTLGDITCFSFYANKTMTTGEGGMVTTNSEKYARRMKVMRLHGFDRPVWDRYTNSARNKWEYDVIAPGFKYNMPDLNAAVGLAQLERAEHARARRMMQAVRYTQAFGEMQSVQMLKRVCNIEEHSWHLFPILLGSDLNISRNQFLEELSKCKVGTSVHYKPLHQLSYYKENFALIPEDYPGAEHLWRSTLSLPIYASLTESEQDFVIDRVSELIAIYS